MQVFRGKQRQTTFPLMPGYKVETDILISRDTIHQDYMDVLALMQRDLLYPETIPARRLRTAQAREGYQALLDREVLRGIFDWSET